MHRNTPRDTAGRAASMVSRATVNAVDDRKAMQELDADFLHSENRRKMRVESPLKVLLRHFKRPQQSSSSSSGGQQKQRGRDMSQTVEATAEAAIEEKKITIKVGADVQAVFTDKDITLKVGDAAALVMRSGQRHRSSVPARQHRPSLRGLDLHGEAAMIDLEHRVVPFVGRTADGIGHQNDPISEIDSSQHRGKNADVGFRAGDDQTIGIPFLQVGDQRLLCERGISHLVDNMGGRHEPVQRRHQLQHVRVQMFAGGLMPSLIIGTPHPRHFVRSLRRDEASEYCALREAAGDLGNDRQHPVQPRSRPGADVREEHLHIHAKMHRAVRQRQFG